MNIFKFDLMTVLIIVVLIGVIATMTTQASDQAVPGIGVVKISNPVADTAHTLKL